MALLGGLSRQLNQEEDSRHHRRIQMGGLGHLGHGELFEEMFLHLRRSFQTGH